MSKTIPADTQKPTYLVCISDTDYSRTALQFAEKIAQRTHGKLIVLHVTEPLDYKSFGLVADKMQVERKKEARKLLHDVTETIGVEKTLMVREGFIEDEIVKVVGKNDHIHMVILGAAAHTSAKNKILQPLVAQLGHKIMVPMLIIPGNITPQQIELLA